ncbi:MAG: peptide ABC transporter substrate-binding protein [Pontiellaceae bacterium]|nr:peptide ABC transporter substrate-binding protein [Pontiellaceae bacterium]
MTSRNLLLISAALLVAACSKRETPVEIGNREQILHRGIGADPQDLDPQTTSGNPEFYVQSALFEGLTSQMPGDSTPVPGTAESWEISEDGKTYTFHIRQNAKWSNGDPVTARDFVFSYQRALSPALANPYAYMLFCLENAEAFNKGEITDFSKVGAKAIDDKTLELKLENPVPYLLRLLKHHSWFPVHESTILAYGKLDQRDTKWTRPGNLVGNGPFMLTEWKQNSKLVVVKNPHYWDAQTVRLKEIHFYPIEDINSEEYAFRTGQLHITIETPPERIKHYKENAPELIHLDPWLGTYYYEINTQQPPFNDVRVRRALALALDRDKIVKNVLKAGEPAALSLTPPGTGGYTPRAQIEYNVEEARRLLAEAGYPNGKGFPKVELLYNTHKGHMRIAEVVQQIWKENLNIDISLLNMEWKTYLAQKKAHKYSIARAAWVGDYEDPSTFLDMFITGGGNNDAAWSNMEYDRLIKEAATEMDQDKRYELYQQAEQILIEEVPVIPIYFYRSKQLVTKSVKNWEPSLLDRHPYKYLYLEADE